MRFIRWLGGWFKRYHSDIDERVASLEDRMDNVERVCVDTKKMAQATQGKVYREINKGEVPGGDGADVITPPTNPLGSFRAGDPLTPELMKYI